MITVVTPQKLTLSAGTFVKTLGQWKDYEILIKQRGEKANPRIKYRDGEILLMSPLPKHGLEANLIADIIKVLLDYFGKKYEAFTPMTMSLPEISGIEPDYSFYIHNWQVAVGKDRIDWDNEPSPDLVLEIDVTSYTDINDYLPYKIPEVWIYKKNQLLIYHLEIGNYVIANNSLYFPDIEMTKIVTESLELAQKDTSSVAINFLRKCFPGA
ncbi:Uma2 family endonuclease [Geminocystis sp. GBBB08]|uniref:Uma2 family endonuclease n=1 Tax=Geminocystis sp. GBBB08 TaxID=2604140 RepID=UPI0027E308A1|nr:Uma2 family endonuclease [Geminocystis sp. GBBB08]MBL1209995.1 Uma2 family endonuclease [Geminocystis sp. GBBB08]